MTAVDSPVFQGDRFLVLGAVCYPLSTGIVWTVEEPEEGSRGEVLAIRVQGVCEELASQQV